MLSALDGFGASHLVKGDDADDDRGDDVELQAQARRRLSGHRSARRDHRGQPDEQAGQIPSSCILINPSRLDGAFERPVADGVEQADGQQQQGPPDVGVEIGQGQRLLRGTDQVVQAGAEDQHAVNRQQHADEEPDWNFSLMIHDYSFSHF